VYKQSSTRGWYGFDYAHPTLGMGLAFRDVKPDFRIVMQKWLLTALQEKEPQPCATVLSGTAQISSREPPTVELAPLQRSSVRE
jgi:hypothetical protein